MANTLGIIGNLSLGGMMLITTRQLYTDGILQLKIERPAGLGRDPVPMGVKIFGAHRPTARTNTGRASRPSISATPTRMRLQQLVAALEPTGPDQGRATHTPSDAN